MMILSVLDFYRERMSKMKRNKPKQMPPGIMDIHDVMAATGLAYSTSAKLIKTLNNELKEKGKLTVPGQIAKSYFRERYYGYGLDS